MEGVSIWRVPSNSNPHGYHDNQVQISGDDKMLSLKKETFESREDLLAAVREIALQQGYATVIRKSKTGRYVIIGCDRGGTYRCTKIPLEKRKRKTASRLIDCPFEICGKQKIDRFWKVEIKNLSHNHEPSADLSGHPSCRRFSKEESVRIKELSKAGVAPRQIITCLRQNNPDLLAISKNVYNETYKIRKQSLGGRTVIQALLDELGDGGFTHNIGYDQSGHLTHLFFAHPYSIELTKNFPNVFVMDCTYKTNKYKMPLLDIIGVSSFNTSFYSCFVFMQKEEEEDYVWALTMFSKLLGDDSHPVAIISDRELALMKAIQVVFPRTAHILCVWHIEKNIVSKCKCHFPDEDDWVEFIRAWTRLIESPNEAAFGDAWNEFEVKYKARALASISYLKGNWVPMKEKFVSAWTNQFMHFGNRVTSRAEGAHAMLKQYLQVSTGGLREVKEKICLAIENQFQEIKAQLSSEKICVSHKLQIPLFKELVTYVSKFALDELYGQYELSKSNDLSSQCKGHFFRTMGLPCAHMIKEMESEALQLKDIHGQWRIDTRLFSSDHDASLDVERDEISDLLSKCKTKFEKLPLSQKEATRRQLSQFVSSSLPLILEPTLQPHKGRPQKSKKRKDSSSTQRDPSLFEIVESSRKCGFCKGFGHNIRTCEVKANGTYSNLSSDLPSQVDDGNMVDDIAIDSFAP